MNVFRGAYALSRDVPIAQYIAGHAAVVKVAPMIAESRGAIDGAVSELETLARIGRETGADALLGLPKSVSQRLALATDAEQIARSFELLSSTPVRISPDDAAHLPTLYQLAEGSAGAFVYNHRGEVPASVLEHLARAQSLAPTDLGAAHAAAAQGVDELHTFLAPTHAYDTQFAATRDMLAPLTGMSREHMSHTYGLSSKLETPLAAAIMEMRSATPPMGSSEMYTNADEGVAALTRAAQHLDEAATQVAREPRRWS